MWGEGSGFGLNGRLGGALQLHQDIVSGARLQWRLVQLLPVHWPALKISLSLDFFKKSGNVLPLEDG